MQMKVHEKELANYVLCLFSAFQCYCRKENREPGLMRNRGCCVLAFAIRMDGTVSSLGYYPILLRLLFAKTL